MENFEKLMKIQTELNAPKNQFNSYGKYNFRNCEDILEALKPLLKKYSCAILLEDNLEVCNEKTYIKSTASLTDGKTGEIIKAISAYARESVTKSGMDDAQITGAASSYARKRALGGLLAIDDNKDPDSNEYKEERDNQIKKEAKTYAKTKKKTTTADDKLEKARAKLDKLVHDYLNNKIVDRDTIMNVLQTTCGGTNYNRFDDVKVLDNAYKEIKKLKENK